MNNFIELVDFSDGARFFLPIEQIAFVEDTRGNAAGNCRVKLKTRGGFSLRTKDLYEDIVRAIDQAGQPLAVKIALTVDQTKEKDSA